MLEGYRRWTAGFETGSVVAWEMAYGLYSELLGDSQRQPCTCPSYRYFIRTLRHCALCPLKTFPFGSHHVCREECMTIRARCRASKLRHGCGTNMPQCHGMSLRVTRKSKTLRSHLPKHWSRTGSGAPAHSKICDRRHYFPPVCARNITKEGEKCMIISSRRERRLIRSSDSAIDCSYLCHAHQDYPMTDLANYAPSLPTLRRKLLMLTPVKLTSCRK